MTYKTIIKNSNLLTLPKIAFGLLFILLMIGSIIKADSIISILIHDWFDVLLTLFIVIYILNTAFKETNFPIKNPFTTLILLLFSFYILYIDIRLIFSIIQSDMNNFKNIYLGLWIGSFWGIPVLLITLAIDSVSNISNDTKK